MTVKYKELSVLELTWLASPVISLNDLQYQGENGEVYYFLKDENSFNPEKELEKKEIISKLYEALNQNFTSEEKTIIEYRLGLSGEHKTLIEVGELIGKSRETVRQIELKVKKRIKDKLIDLGLDLSNVF